MSVLLGAKLPSSGAVASQIDLREASRSAEQAGFDSVWVSDHLVMPRHVSSPYPYSVDGKMTWNPKEPWHDALIAMATAAAVTSRVEVGVGVLILPMRNPLVLAKQVSSLDSLSGGRVVLGVGAGWLKEEFEALDAPFDQRGQRLDQWIEILRDCWTGQPQGVVGPGYRLVDDVLLEPTPAHPVPVIIGGMSPAALRRVARLGDGWFALQRADDINVDELRAGTETIAAAADRLGRHPPERLVVRIAGPTKRVAEHLPSLAEVGVTDVVVDVDWENNRGPKATEETLRAALA